jgi:hypothetical protein
MKLPKYVLSSGENLITFEFISTGTNGKITKIIQFSKTNIEDVYNLAFGDKDVLTGKIDDTVVSNNGDSDKVLATITDAVLAFTDKYPNAFVYATGSTKARTRLYRMGISKFINEIKKDFEVYGETEHEWQEFKRNNDYAGFLLKRK